MICRGKCTGAVEAWSVTRTSPNSPGCKACCGKLDLLAGYVAPFGPHPRSSARQILALMGGLEEQWLREEGAFDLAGEFDAAITLILP